MGKSLIQQKRGKGSTSYRTPGHRFKGRIKYFKKSDEMKKGVVFDLYHCPGHGSPMVKIRVDGEEMIMSAAEGIKIGDVIECGPHASFQLGNITRLGDIPKGAIIFNIEGNPGDGGKFVRSAGAFAKVLSQSENRVLVQLPSKKQKEFDVNCRACIGKIAGGGKLEKPFLKAGKRYHAMRARNKLYPVVAGISMNSVNHPFGGSRSSKKGRPTIAPKNAPPGRKVGKIRPRRTGRNK